MKHGSEYAKEIKRLQRQMLRQFGKPDVPAQTDPIEQLILAILSSCSTDHKAMAVYRRLREQMVDLNELRVTPAMELAETIGDSLPMAKDKAQRVVDALNAVRRRQDKLDLSFLHQRGRREAREYLESLEGVDKAAAAGVVLFSLGGHAIPVDDLILYVLRQEKLVDPEADVTEVQGFLERTIPAAEAATFAILLGRYAAQKMARVPSDRLQQLLHPAPPPPPAPEKPPAAKPPVPAPVAGKNGKQEPVKEAFKDGKAKETHKDSKHDKAAKAMPASAVKPVHAPKKAAGSPDSVGHAKPKKK